MKGNKNIMDTTQYKERIEQELADVTKDLQAIGRVNPDNPKDWEAVPEEMDIDAADSNVVADKFEEFENNKAALNQLETRFNELKDALARIDAGAFGNCEVCGKEIEPERLGANPAARTCIEHVES